MWKYYRYTMFILKQCCFIEFWQLNLYWTLPVSDWIFPTLAQKLLQFSVSIYKTPSWLSEYSPKIWRWHSIIQRLYDCSGSAKQTKKKTQTNLYCSVYSTLFGIAIVILNLRDNYKKAKMGGKIKTAFGLKSKIFVLFLCIILPLKQLYIHFFFAT